LKKGYPGQKEIFILLVLNTGGPPLSLTNKKERGRKDGGKVQERVILRWLMRGGGGRFRGKSVAGKKRDEVADPSRKNRGETPHLEKKGKSKPPRKEKEGEVRGGKK